MLAARDARRDDYCVFARLFAELRIPDPTPTEEQFDARIRPHAFFLWDDAGADARPLAYAFWLALGDVARVSHVVVDPAARGRGVGGALMRELAERGRGAGCSRWQLNVKPDNTPAIRLYERCGMRAAGRAYAMEIAWDDVARLPGEEGLVPFLVASGDDARVEAATGLLSGQIAARRAGGASFPVALRRGDDVVAFGAFDPSFPGAMPFVAPHPALTRALLEAMRPHALPGRPFVRFLADEAVADAAREAGAETRIELLRMEGEIG